MADTCSFPCWDTYPYNLATARTGKFQDWRNYHHNPSFHTGLSSYWLQSLKHTSLLCMYLFSYRALCLERSSQSQHIYSSPQHKIDCQCKQPAWLTHSQRRSSIRRCIYIRFRTGHISWCTSWTEAFDAGSQCSEYRWRRGSRLGS